MESPSQIAPAPAVRRAILLPLAAACGAGLVLAGCDRPEPAARVVAESIQVHGGDRFLDMDVTFTFRDARFRVVQDGGRFHYERTYTDPEGREVLEMLTNDGVAVRVDGEPVALDPGQRARVETAVNSVVYFGFLPFRLQDPAVQLRDLGEAQVAGETYHKVEVTFREEGGGTDWEDRFVYWIHRDGKTLDYLAYRYQRDGGGTRFRRAVNRREVGGLLVQDYENYRAGRPLSDIADYDRLLEEGDLELLSMVELEEVAVASTREAAPPTTDEPPALAPDEGFEVQLGIGRADYSPGDSMHTVIRLVNRADHSRSLDFPTSQRYDFVILSEEGEEVYRWSQDRAFLQVLGEEALGPGEGVEWDEVLPAPGESGSYLLQGIVPAAVGPLAAELPLEVR